MRDAYASADDRLQNFCGEALRQIIPDSYSACADRRYDVTTDDFIDRGEFHNGLMNLGLNYTADSLNLDAAQQAELIDFIFSGPDVVIVTEVRSWLFSRAELS